MKTREFEDEAVVVKEGDMGDEFFIIQANPPPPAPPLPPWSSPLAGAASCSLSPQGRRRRLSEASYAQWRFGGAVCLNPSVRGELCAVLRVCLGRRRPHAYGQLVQHQPDPQRRRVRFRVWRRVFPQQHQPDAKAEEGLGPL